MTTYKPATVDFRQLRTADTLAQFATRIGSAPYQIFRRLLYSPMFIGPSERPSYRVHTSLSDLGDIIQTWPDGTRFRNQGDRDRAMLAEAARTAPDDPTAAEARRILENGGRGRRTEPLAAAQGYPDTLAARTGELRDTQAAERQVQAS